MIEKISRMDPRKVLNLSKTVSYICFGLMFIIMIAVLPLNDTAIIWLLTIVVAILLFLIIFIKRFLSKIAAFLLLEGIDLKGYQNFIITDYQTSPKQLKSKLLQETYISEAQVHFLRGNYQQSLDSLSQVFLEKVVFKRRKAISHLHNYYTNLNHIHLSQPLESVCEQYQLELNAIQQIVEGGTSTYFNSRQGQTRLEKVKIVYYQGLNALNGGNLEEAKKLFESISTENPELFYVQKANDYLGELSHDKP